MKVTLTEPGIAGSYVVAEKRPDGVLVLEPEREKLFAAIAEADGKVFRDEEFIEHSNGSPRPRTTSATTSPNNPCRHSSADRGSPKGRRSGVPIAHRAPR